MTELKKPALWTVPEVADYYRVTERTVRNWIDKGALDVERKGRTVRVHAPGQWKTPETSTGSA